MKHYRNSLPAWPAAICCAAAAVIAGCQPASPPEVHPVWPPPPAAARVVHVKNVRGAADLGKPNAFDAFSAWITGKSPLRLIRPHGVAVDENQRLYVTDQELQAMVIFDTPSAKATAITRVGDVFLVSPVGVAVCGGHVALSDSALRSVYVLSSAGKLERTIDRPGGWKRPTGLAYDGVDKRLYVADTLANEICVFEFESGRLVSTLGSAGVATGKFNFPTHLFLDRQRRLYVTDSMNGRVQIFSREGEYQSHIGRPGDASGHVGVPKGVGVDSFGHIYVVDSYFGTVQIFDQKGAFLLSVGEMGDGPGKMQIPTGLTVDSADRIYVCDSFNKRVQILQYVGGATHDANTPHP